MGVWSQQHLNVMWKSPVCMYHAGIIEQIIRVALNFWNNQAQIDIRTRPWFHIIPILQTK